MGSSAMKPALHTRPYPAISEDSLRGSLDGKIAVITGAAGVLGRGETLAFAKAGATLALIDLPRAADALATVVEECRALGATALPYCCNVIDEAESRATLARIQKDLGAIDVLVNNAGGTIDRPFHMETFEQFWSIVDLNFKAPMLWTHMLTDAFRERKTGVIVNIASRSATVNSPFSANYASAKAALVRASGCIQLELDIDGFENIDIYSVHPGATKTNLQKPLAPDVAAQYPKAAEAYVKFTSNFPCSPSLCGQTCVFLSAGRGKALRGRYFDCEQDVGYVATMGDSIRDQGLYDLKVEFLGGLPNDGGTMPDALLMEL